MLFLTLCVRTDRGPVLNSSSSLFASSSSVSPDLGLDATEEAMAAKVVGEYIGVWAVRMVGELR